MITYGFKKTVSHSVQETEEKVRAALDAHKFGIITRIDMSAKLKEKLGVDFKNYIILGACNPPNAYAALQVEEDIGLMLPCNVVLYESDDGGTTISFIKPSVAMGMIENKELEKTAGSVEDALKKAFDEIE